KRIETADADGVAAILAGTVFSPSGLTEGIVLMVLKYEAQHERPHLEGFCHASGQQFRHRSPSTEAVAAHASILASDRRDLYDLYGHVICSRIHSDLSHQEGDSARPRGDCGRRSAQRKAPAGADLSAKRRVYREGGPTGVGAGAARRDGGESFALRSADGSADGPGVNQRQTGVARMISDS